MVQLLLRDNWMKPHRELLRSIMATIEGLSDSTISCQKMSRYSLLILRIKAENVNRHHKLYCGILNSVNKVKY